MKVMITGSKGQLGYDLSRVIQKSHQTIRIG